MVKIPEMPGGYRPGDVVNGHVLNDRGHWVPVEGASAPTHGSAPQVSASSAAPASAPAPVHAANPASPHTSNPYLNPAPPRPGAGGTTKSKGPAVVGCAVFAAVAIGMLVIFVVLANQLRSDFVGVDQDPGWSVDWDAEDLPVIDDPLDGFDPLPEVPSWTLTDEERELFEVVDWDVFHGAYSSHFVVTVAAPGLTRAHAGTIVQITAVDADGTTHEGSDFVWLDEGEPTLAVGFFREQFTGDVAELTAEFQPLGVENEPNPYAVDVTGYEIHHDSVRPRLAVTLEAGAYGEAPPAVRVAAIARDAEGQILNLGLGYPEVPALGETSTVDVYLWGETAVPDGATWEIVVMNR